MLDPPPRALRTGVLSWPVPFSCFLEVPAYRSCTISNKFVFISLSHQSYSCHSLPATSVHRLLPPHSGLTHLNTTIAPVPAPTWHRRSCTALWTSYASIPLFFRHVRTSHLLSHA